jgi:acetyltransferase
VELRAGLVEDPVFGPRVAFGQGGASVEIQHDSSLELPPLNSLVAQAYGAHAGGQLLHGYRGQKAATIEAVVGSLIRLGQLAADHPEICELEINPFLVDADGTSRSVPGCGSHGQSSGAARLAIAPYPQDLASVERLRDGREVRLRPGRRADAARPRYAYESSGFAAAVLYARTRADPYGRCTAVAARLRPRIGAFGRIILDERALGVVHFFAEPEKRRAEYAIAVRSDWKGRGLGYLLMTRLIDIARQRGVRELVGEVLRENEPMLSMCRELGFAVTNEPGDPVIVMVSKTLVENGL